MVILEKHMKEYPPKTHGVVLIAALFFAILLASCEQPKKNAAPSAKTATTAAVAAAETTTTPPKLNTEGNDKTPSPTATDIAALSNAMHGAASQQSDDAPKDQYGEPYIIGTLGGVPVNLPSSVVRFVEYVDSPGWDMDKIRSYNPPTRNYQSVLKSFDFAFRNSDGALYDENKRDLVKQYRAEQSAGGDDWVRVIISVSPTKEPREYLLDYAYERSFRKWATAAEEPYAFTGEYRYGLEYYVVPGINPETQKPWREDDGVDDLFIYKGEDGHVVAYIKCANENVASPPCTHYFEMLSPMRLGNVRLAYNRQHLGSWKEIQEKAKAFILSFPAKAN